MQKAPLHFSKTNSSIPTSQLTRFAEGWLLDGEIRQHSPQTLAIRRLLIGKLQWFLDDRKAPERGIMELRQFFAHISNGHTSNGGRWGDTKRVKQVRPKTVKSITITCALSFIG